MKFLFLPALILLLFTTCRKNNDNDRIIADFSGTYQCVKYSYTSYHVPEIDTTFYYHDTENVVVEIMHCPDPDSIIITTEQAAKIQVLIQEDSTFTNYDPHGPIISGLVTTGAFSILDSIRIKSSGWMDTQYYMEYKYYGVKLTDRYN